MFLRFDSIENLPVRGGREYAPGPTAFMNVFSAFSYSTWLVPVNTVAYDPLWTKFPVSNFILEAEGS